MADVGLLSKLSWPGLTVDADQHRYYLHDAELVSVGSVLKGVGLIDTYWMDKHPEGRTRGHYVHQACELVDQNALDESTLHPALTPYVAGYRKFVAKHQPRWIASEQPVALCDENEKPQANGWREGYAGTPDRIELIDGAVRVWDIKSGQKQPSHRWQTAAYATAVARKLGTDPRNIERRIVRLTKAGGFVVDGADWDADADIKVWMAAARVVNTRITNRLWHPQIES